MALSMEELESEFRACKRRLEEVEEKYVEVLKQLTRVSRELERFKNMRCPLWERIDELEERYDQIQKKRG
jgi:chromosome segregation ATPase